MRVLMKNKWAKSEFNVLIVFIVLFFMLFLTGIGALADPVRTIRLSDDAVATIHISTRGTVLSFPVKPTKVILGRSGSFGIEYVENDLAISPLNLSARSNLFVYLFGRRFSFNLVASADDGNAVILVRDALDPSDQKSRSKSLGKK